MPLCTRPSRIKHRVLVGFRHARLPTSASGLAHEGLAHYRPIARAGKDSRRAFCGEEATLALHVLRR